MMPRGGPYGGPGPGGAGPGFRGGPGAMPPMPMPGGGYMPPPQRPQKKTSRGKQEDKDPFASQMTAFADLFTSEFENEHLKFVAINTDELDNTQAVIDKLLENPWPWAQVMAQAPASGAAKFADIDAAKPTLAIAAEDGRIKYAGPVAGFLARMVLDGLGIPTSTGSAPAIKNVGSVGKIARAVATNTSRPQPQPYEEPTDITPESYQAQKLLEGARTFLQIGNKFTTPKKGIEMCRQILRDYPNSRYANEARLLLRQVPERYRKRYKVTNEEMGL